MAGEGDAERLVVLLEARIRDFEKNMQKAAGTADKNYGRMRKDSRSATQQMEQDMIRSTSRINQALAATSTKIGAYGKAFAGGLVGGIAAGGIAGIVSQISEIAHGLAEVGDKAKTAGLSTEAFQELAYVAKVNRIEVDALTDGMKELSLRADEFIQTGGGSAAEAFGRLGYSADQLKVKLKDPSALFTEIIGKLGQLDRAAQIRIADELFGGTGGEKFVQLIEQGEDGIRSTIQEAHRLGAVMDDDVIKRADELDRKFQAITTTVSTGLKTAIVEAASEMQKFINTFQGWWEKYEQRLQASRLGDLAGSLAGTTSTGPTTRTTEKTGRLPKAESSMPSSEQLSTGYLKAYRAELALTNHERAVAAEQERILSDAASKGIRVTKEQAEALAREKVARDEGEAASKKLSGERDRAATKTAAEAQKVRDLISELQEELSLVGASNTEKDIANTLRRAGVDATSKEGQKIAELITQINAETEALQKQKEAQEAQKEALDNLFGMANDGIQGLVAGTESASDAVKKLAAQLALALAQAALFGSGPLAGLFSGGGLLGGMGMFPGGFGFASAGGFAAMLGLADGGSIRGPGTSTSDSIPIMASDGEFMVNAKAAKKNRGLLEAINAGMSFDRFATGGRIGMPAPPENYSRGASVGALKVEVNNYGEPADATVSQRTDADGTRVLEVMMEKKIQDEVTRPSAKTNRNLRGMYGLSNQVVRR